MKHSLFVKIVGTVVIGISLLTILLAGYNYGTSKQIFVNTFSQSQKKIFAQIDSDFYDFFRMIGEIDRAVSKSWAAKQYLTGQHLDTNEEYRTIYYMREHLVETRLEEFSAVNLILLGENGKDFVWNNSTKVVTPDAIRSGKAVRQALEHRGELICVYEEQGYTTDQVEEPVVMLAKCLEYDKDEEADGLLLFVIREREFQKIYDYFSSDTCDVVIFNQNMEPVSSNYTPYVTGEEKIKISDEHFMQNISGTNFKMLGMIDFDYAFQKRYNFVAHLILLLSITAIVAVIIFFFLRQQTKPLTNLTKKMRHITEDDFQGYVEVEGTDEVRELSETYNKMLGQIHEYIDRIIEVQKEKRNAEIHALQMQINPHYIYNTLASIKWLIWQGNADKSTKVIDAFIQLLRNTISNTEEFITVEQEVENLKNYVLINQTRYGDSIDVNYYILDSCKHYLIPKLILQPFVENAFFHGFPQGEKGEISVFVREKDENLQFEISDNGIGMDKEQLSNLQEKKNRKTEHFTGIGVNNVDDRLKLIYGQKYGIEIRSEKEFGTTIQILLPRREN